MIRENELHKEHERSIGKGEIEGLVDYGGLWITARFNLWVFFWMCKCSDDANVIEAEKWVYGCRDGLSRGSVP